GQTTQRAVKYTNCYNDLVTNPHAHGDRGVHQPVLRACAQAGGPFTVTWAPVASVTKAAPNNWPTVHAPGSAPARTRRVASAAMAAVARTPSPVRSSALRVCPSGPVTSAQAHEPVPLLCAPGFAM